MSFLLQRRLPREPRKAWRPVLQWRRKARRKPPMRKTTMPGLGFLGREELWCPASFAEIFQGFFPNGFPRIPNFQRVSQLLKDFPRFFFSRVFQGPPSCSKLIRHFVGFFFKAVGTVYIAGPKVFVGLLGLENMEAWNFTGAIFQRF